MTLKRTPLKKGGGLKRGKSRLKAKPKTEEQKEYRKQMREFFEYMWTIRSHYSEVSGAYLGGECKSIYQHHILPKSSHKEAAFDPENIIFLTPDEHTQVEWDIYCFEEVNIRREKLKLKYAKTQKI